MYRIEIDRHKAPLITETRSTFDQARRAVMIELDTINDAKEARIIYIPEWRIIWSQTFKTYKNDGKNIVSAST